MPDVYVRFLPKYNGLNGEVYIAEKFSVNALQRKYQEYVNFQQMGGEIPLDYDGYKSLHVIARLENKDVSPIVLEHVLVKKLVDMKYVRVDQTVNGKHLIALHRLRQHLSRVRFLA